MITFTDLQSKPLTHLVEIQQIEIYKLKTVFLRDRNRSVRIRHIFPAARHAVSVRQRLVSDRKYPVCLWSVSNNRP